MPQKNLTIGIDARMWGSQQTGIGRYVSSLCEEFFVQASRINYILFVREPSSFKKFTYLSNIRIVPVRERWYSVGEQVTLPLKFFGKKMDVLFVPHFNVPLLWKGRFVVTIHDVTPLFFPGHLQKISPIRTRAFKKVFSSTLQRARHIIAVSSYTKHEIMKHFDADQGKVSVVYEGVSDLVSGPLDEKMPGVFKKRFGLITPYLFFVGVWRPHKNIVGLLEAFALLKKRYGLPYQLVLGGEEDPRYPEIRAAWQRLGLETDIVRPGFIPDNELPYWYKGAALVVIPSFVEGFGLVGLEAMQYGALVAASNGGATPEILQDAAYYFDPYNIEEMVETMYQALMDQEARPIHLARAHAIVRRYSWKESARQTLDILRNAAQ